jgi:hypothetical protein
METLLKRISAALLLGFGVFVISLPVACSGFVVYNEHLTGDVESNGPQAILSGMVLAAVLAMVAGVLVMVKSRRR